MKSYGVLPERIAVVDDKHKFISNTHPARVRKLLKSGKARVFSKNPFVIELIQKGENGAKKMKPITNFVKYFSGEERDVYIKNTSNTQVSMQFETSPGHFEHVLIPKTRQPFNLTQHIPFVAIKQSTDLRRLVNRRPPVLQLMSEEEYNQYYESLAESRGTTLDEEINKSLEEHSELMDKRAFAAKNEEKGKSIEDLKKEHLEDPEANAEMQPLPVVVGLCAQVGKGMTELSPEEMMTELEQAEPDLRPTDYEYIASHGYYKIIKKWANQRHGKSIESTEEDSK